MKTIYVLFLAILLLWAISEIASGEEHVIVGGPAENVHLKANPARPERKAGVAAGQVQAAGWSAPVVILDPARSYSMDVDNQGRWHIVYHELEFRTEGGVNYYRTFIKYKSQTSGAPSTVAEALESFRMPAGAHTGASVSSPSIAIDPAGAVHVAYTRANFDDDDDPRTMYTKTTAAPAVLDVSSSFCDDALHAYFLDGFSCEAAFDAQVEWYGKTPGTIVFKTPWETDEGESPSRTYDVGEDFGVGEKLEVKAVAADGTQSAWYTVNFDVIGPPPGIPAELLHRVPGAPGLLYKTDVGFGLPQINEGAETGLIPASIPLVGGKALKWASIINVTAEVNGSGTAQLRLDPIDTGMKLHIAGRRMPVPQIGLDLVWTYSPAQEKWLPGGHVFFAGGLPTIHAGPAYAVVVIGPVPVPVYWRATFDAGAEVGLGLIAHDDGVAFDGGASADFMVKGFVGVGVAHMLSGEVYVGGGGQIGLQYPAEPHLQDLALVFVAGFRGTILCFQRDFEILHYTWNIYGPQQTGAPGPTLASLPGFHPMSRDYLKGSYAVFLGGRTLLTMALSGGPVDEAPIQTNVYPMSEPSLCMAGPTPVLAWIYDDPGRSLNNRTKLVFSTYDGSAWAPPGSVADDGKADFAPALANFPTGDAILAWQHASEVLPDDAGLEAMLPILEIYAARYDGTGGTWSGAARITSNGYLDGTPRIASATDGTALLAWVSNPDNDVIGSLEHPNVIMSSEWDGASWTPPEEVATVPGAVVQTTLSYNGAEGHLVFEQDSDDDLTTIEDRELSHVAWGPSGWSAVTKLTNNNVADMNPRAARSTSGEWLLAWQREDELVFAKDFAIGDAEPVIDEAASSSVGNFSLAAGATGEIALTWGGVSDEGMDIFTAILDPDSGIWSRPIQLTHDTALERSITAGLDAAGSLLAVYNKVEITESSVDVEVDGEMVTVEGVPQFGQSDLCFLKYEPGTIDLAVDASGVTLSNTNPHPDDDVEITAEIRNHGGLPAESVEVAFYDGDPDNGGTPIGDLQTLGDPIPGGGSATAAITWTVPPTTDPKTIYVVADPNFEQDDGDRTNNTCSVPATAPDLVISEIYCQWPWADQCDIIVSTENRGSAACSGARVSLRRGGVDGELVHEFQIEGELPVDATHYATFNWFLIGQTPTPGQIMFYAVADEADDIPELAENNNTGFVATNVSGWNIQGDATEDCTVNILDMLFIRDQLGENVDSGDNWKCDLNNDDQINILDMLMVREHLNDKCQ